MGNIEAGNGNPLVPPIRASYEDERSHRNPELARQEREKGAVGPARYRRCPHPYLQGEAMHPGYAFGAGAWLHVGPQDHPTLRDLAQPGKVRAGRVARLSSVTMLTRFTHPTKHLTPLSWLWSPISR